MLTLGKGVLTELGNSKLACEQEGGGGGGGKKGEKKRERKGESVGIHQYFDCRNFIIYAGPSINYSNYVATTTATKY